MDLSYILFYGTGWSVVNFIVYQRYCFTPVYYVKIIEPLYSPHSIGLTVKLNIYLEFAGILI